jgi:hypothetical protein
VEETNPSIVARIELVCRSNGQNPSLQEHQRKAFKHFALMPVLFIVRVRSSNVVERAARTVPPDRDLLRNLLSQA